MSATQTSVTPAQVHGYISDMLGQLAEMAAGAGAGKLERALRMLALEAAAQAAEAHVPRPGRAHD